MYTRVTESDLAYNLSRNRLSLTNRMRDKAWKAYAMAQLNRDRVVLRQAMCYVENTLTT